ncbi:MAG: hypothetical protein H6656_01180 [Ardenticatenaceae bacterium]|nr:hypothetical protein [Anaerolineales bacterium]MCB9005999.1 hypothetical protein [Ardenticatenaceae bacterium]
MDTVWQDRWQTLQEQLEQMTLAYGQADDSSSKTLFALTKCLLAFGDDQFSYFWDGFSSGQLLPSMVFPPEHVFRATLDQIAFDMMIIQRIYSQRQQTKLHATQERADKLAQLALNVAIQDGLLPKCSVLTYFNKSANIRIIPYAPIALIGIPFSAVKVRKDLLSIPHEVGHYVYHHAPGLAAQLHAHIPLYPNWINCWLEEIFADVFAAYVAGPAGALSLQDLLLDNSQEKFVRDDGEHPPDAIRPYCINQAIRALGDDKIANDLDALWEERLSKRHYPHDFIPFGSSTPTPLAEAQALMVKTADIFLNYLETERQMSRPNPWSNSNDIDTLFTAFTTWSNQPPPVEQHHLLVEGEKVGVAAANGRTENPRRIGDTLTWRDWIKVHSRQHSNVQLPAQAWLPVFTAGHWPVKGPEGNSNGGI